MAAYGGYYTRQEQEDAMAARIDNPNRVGSGFINLGPQQRAPAVANTNWQTGSLLGGGPGVAHAAPPGVSDIWNNAPQPPQPPPRAPPPPAPMGMPPGMGAGGFGRTAAEQANLGLGFENLSMGGGAGSAGAPYPGALGVGLGEVPPRAPAPQAAALMSLLQTPTPNPTPAALNSAFTMGNGGHSSRAFANPAIPQAVPPVQQLQPNGVHSAAFPAGAFAPPVAQQVTRPQPGPPRNLHSAADYAAAAQTYKPPVPPRNSSQAVVSVSRVPEASKSQPSQPAKEEWECPRCTFLNNIALRECEMCGFERVGKDEAPAQSRSEDDGWRTATPAVRKSAPVPNQSNSQPGKSKAQSKNEKRRAKKRGDH